MVGHGRPQTAMASHGQPWLALAVLDTSSPDCVFAIHVVSQRIRALRDELFKHVDVSETQALFQCALKAFAVDSCEVAASDWCYD